MIARLLIPVALAAAADRVGAGEAPKTSAHPPIEGKTAPAQQKGKVLEVLNAGNYTYARVDTGKKKLWLAGPTAQVKVGDRVVFSQGMEMKDFKSNALGRTFDVIYFVGNISREGVAPTGGQLPAGHPQVAKGASPAADAKWDYSRLAKPAGGKTVAEILRDKTQLSGKKIIVRGKVVKFTGEIMGKNWLHLKDGSVKEGAEDLTVTTKATVKVGDTVLVRGAVATDKDFGFGYKYAVIVEDAEVTVE
jgi:hypothetical protein